MDGGSVGRRDASEADDTSGRGHNGRSAPRRASDRDGPDGRRWTDRESYAKPAGGRRVLTDGGIDPAPGGALRRARQFDAVVRAVLFGWIGFGAMLGWRIGLSWVLQPLVGLGLPVPMLEAFSVMVSFGLGAVTGAMVYLRFFDLGADFLDVSPLSLRKFGYAIGGGIVTAGLIGGGYLLVRVSGLDEPEYIVVDQAQQLPEVLLVLAPLAILIVGPGEELLYRNVVQKSLYETFSRRNAIVIASVVFASVHLFTYSTTLGSLQAMLATLVLLFVFSLSLGWLYSRTENVVVPAVVHGLYSAGQLLVLYI